MIDYKPITDKAVKSMEETGQLLFEDYLDELVLAVSVCFPEAFQDDNLRRFMKSEVLRIFLKIANNGEEKYEYIEKTGVIKKKMVKLD